MPKARAASKVTLPATSVARTATVQMLAPSLRQSPVSASTVMVAEAAELQLRAVKARVITALLTTWYSHETRPLVASLSEMLTSKLVRSKVAAAGLLKTTTGPVKSMEKRRE